MERKVRICDDCEDKIAKIKCVICGRDICKDCGGSAIEFNKYSESSNLYWKMFFKKEKMFCGYCVGGIRFKDLKGYDIMKKDIIRKLKDRAMFKGLKNIK